MDANTLTPAIANSSAAAVLTAQNWDALVFMMTSSNGNIFRGTGHLCGEFTGHRWIPHTKASDVFFCLRLYKPLSKQWWGWWFETPSCPLWLHCNVYLKDLSLISLDDRYQTWIYIFIFSRNDAARHWLTRRCRMTSHGHMASWDILANIGSDNGLSPFRRQDISWNYDNLLSTGR